MPLLPPDAWATLGVTHDHRLLETTFDPQGKHFELHFEGAYVVNGAHFPEHMFVDVRIRVEERREAIFEASVTQDLVDPSPSSLAPFNPNVDRLIEVDELDLVPEVRVSGLLEVPPHQNMRWYTVTFQGSRISVHYDHLTLRQ
jgi:hypothetical protein